MINVVSLGWYLAMIALVVVIMIAYCVIVHFFGGLSLKEGLSTYEIDAKDMIEKLALPEGARIVHCKVNRVEHGNDRVFIILKEIK